MKRKNAKRSPSEATIQRNIILYLNSLCPDVYAVKVILCNRRGVPDIICCYRGKFIGLEIKRAGMSVPKHQLFQGQLINHAGGLWYKVESVDDVQNILKTIKG